MGTFYWKLWTLFPCWRMHTHSPENYMKTGYPLGMVLYNKCWITFLSYPEFWGKYDRNRRNNLIRESIFIRSIWNNILLCKKYFVRPRWKALKNNSAAYEKKQSRSAFGLLKVPKLQRISATHEVLRDGVMIVGVISDGVMTVGVLSIGEMTLSH
jgi:hypothetical protein